MEGALDRHDRPCYFMLNDNAAQKKKQRIVSLENGTMLYEEEPQRGLYLHIEPTRDFMCIDKGAHYSLYGMDYGARLSDLQAKCTFIPVQ